MNETALYIIIVVIGMANFIGVFTNAISSGTSLIITLILFLLIILNDICIEIRNLRLGLIEEIRELLEKEKKIK
jgi:hypothetical protein